MKIRFSCIIFIVSFSCLTWAIAGGKDDVKENVAFPTFRMQEIETGLKVGYAVLLVDINGDGKKDIVVVDTNRVVWYENPTWKRRTIIEGQTKPDNVCIAAYDIDGDGWLDLALGADWKPFNTKEGGTIQWLKRGKTLDDPWTLYPIAEEPTVHRMRFVDIDGNGKAALIVAPLMGRNSTAKNNWKDGAPVRILAFRIPKDPMKDRWEPEVIDETLHVVHNFSVMEKRPKRPARLLIASYEGISHLSWAFRFPEVPKPPARIVKPDFSNRKSTLVAEGNQANPKGSRGASEVGFGHLRRGNDPSQFIATIEPWHGHQVVVYEALLMGIPGQRMPRHVIDEQLKWGHAVECADLDGDSSDEVIVGVRDNLSDEPGKRRGVRIYKALDDKGTRWARHIVEDGGVAVEALAVADLNGDGRPDIVAVGRQTGNVRIYWNEGVKK